MLFFYYIIFHGTANNLASSGQKLTHSLQKTAAYAAEILLFTGAAESPVTLRFRAVVNGDSVRQEYTLGEPVALRDCQAFALFAVIGYLYKYMPFVVALRIVAVYYTDAVVKLQSVFEPQTAPRKNLQHPAVVYKRPYSGRNLDRKSVV